MTAVEVCVETANGLLVARSEGAHRAELCSSLDVGGLTPSYGLMKLAAERGVAARALLRPRGGSFVYDAAEAELIENDIAAARELGLEGVVIGAALADGRLDVALLSRLIERSGPLGRTLHRVFDLVPDPLAALESAIELGFDRILTSGGAIRAVDGATRLRELVCAAAGRIVIIAAGGVTPENVAGLVRATGVDEVHASCRQTVPLPLDPVLSKLGFGAEPRRTDPSIVRALVRSASSTVNNGSERVGRDRCF